MPFLSQIRAPSPLPIPLTASFPPHYSPSSACQALQITIHANKSLETRMANVRLLWRPTLGAGSPGGQPVAQVCCGESWEAPKTWQWGDNALCPIGVLFPGRAPGSATSSASPPQGSAPTTCSLLGVINGRRLQKGRCSLGQWASSLPSWTCLTQRRWLE